MFGVKWVRDVPGLEGGGEMGQRRASQVASAVKSRLPTQGAEEARAPPPGREGALGEGAAALSRLLPGEPHGQRSLAGCSPRGRRVGHD